MRSAIAPFVGTLVCLSLLLLSVRPGTGAAPDARGSEIRFSPISLNQEVPGATQKLRPVHPGYSNIAAWISAVGAAVGSTDLNDDGVPNEYCLVDPRDDSVTVGPVPGTASQHPTVTLIPDTASPAPYAPMGCVPADIDMDGAVDVVAYYWGRSPVIFYGDSKGAFRSAELIQPSQVWNTTTLSFADIDGNGRPDLLVGNYFPEGARVLDPAASDDDRMAMQAGMAAARNAGENKLLLQGEDGQFRDSSDRIPGVSSKGWTLAFGAQDLTGDLLPEVYVANDFGPDQLLINRSKPNEVRLAVADGGRSPTAAKSSNLGRDSFKGMGVAYIQLPGVVGPAIAVSNITQEFGLQESNFLFVPGDGTAAALRDGRADYVQRSEEYGLSRSGWSWDIRAADFNNDGQDELVQATGFVQGERNRWPELQELAMANDSLLPFAKSWLNVFTGDDLSGWNTNTLWCLQPGGAFSDCAPAAGIDQTAPTRSFATGDFNADGRTDLIEANQWAPSRVLLNSTETSPGLVLRPVLLDQDGTELSATGAVVTVASSVSTATRQLYPANGHTGVSAAELAYAPGAPAVATISWRDASGRVHQGSVPVPANGRVDLVVNAVGEVVVR